MSSSKVPRSTSAPSEQAPSFPLLDRLGPDLLRVVAEKGNADCELQGVSVTLRALFEKSFHPTGWVPMPAATRDAFLVKVFEAYRELCKGVSKRDEGELMTRTLDLLNAAHKEALKTYGLYFIYLFIPSREVAEDLSGPNASSAPLSHVPPLPTTKIAAYGYDYTPRELEFPQYVWEPTPDLTMIAPFFRAHLLPHVTEIEWKRARIDVDVLFDALAFSNTSLQSLTILSLQTFNVEAATQLAKWLKHETLFAHLTTLDLSGNASLRKEGVIAVLEALEATTCKIPLKNLNISGCMNPEEVVSKDRIYGLYRAVEKKFSLERAPASSIEASMAWGARND